MSIRCSAVATVSGIGNQAKNFYVIHYSCESFYGREGATSPRITSIAIKNLDSGQTHSYSIALVAEENHAENMDMSKLDEFEKKMLDDFFEFIDKHQGVKWLHWNMRSVDFGFQAIEHRYRVLGGQPYVVDDVDKYDLSSILIQIYGKKYISHPRLQNLIERNKISKLNFLTGEEEASAFVKHQYFSLHQSTLRKVDILRNIFFLARARKLKTDMPWWKFPECTYWIEYIKNHWLMTILIFIASVVGVIGSIIK